MDEEEQVEALSFEEVLTIKEASQLLGLAESSIRRMITEMPLESRLATPAEQSRLLATERICGVPGTGIRLISRSSLEAARSRPTQRGWAKGHKRKHEKER